MGFSTQPYLKENHFFDHDQELCTRKFSESAQQAILYILRNFDLESRYDCLIRTEYYRSDMHACLSKYGRLLSNCTASLFSYEACRAIISRGALNRGIQH